MQCLLYILCSCCATIVRLCLHDSIRTRQHRDSNNCYIYLLSLCAWIFISPFVSHVVLVAPPRALMAPPELCERDYFQVLAHSPL